LALVGLEEKKSFWQRQNLFMKKHMRNLEKIMKNKAVINIKPLGFPWETSDPFLFCAHHLDAYPAGNEEMGPATSLEGRNIGMDFTIKDGWRMYHGQKVPGFPVHPHRGFETVTIAKKGFVDHTDSLGCTARFGDGDVQWLTAGKGIQHSEMFPLLNKEQENPFELFQIWLNLPQASKLVSPHFSMLWSETIPRSVVKDENGKTTEIDLIAGNLGDIKAPPPAPDSWAADSKNEIAIWTIKMEPEAKWTLPPASPGLTRTLYFFRGASLKAAGENISSYHSILLEPDQDVLLENGPAESHLLLLQGRPINEPVTQYGPFVMNTPAEIQQAFYDYQKTQFGGWPWESEAHVHPRQNGRFARYIDGREEKK
jgi:redox-sensitive bicupin YhaK (pirin superfamily)